MSELGRMTTLTYKRVERSDPLLSPLNLWPPPRSPPERWTTLFWFYAHGQRPQQRSFSEICEIKDGQALSPDGWALWDPREDWARREDLLEFALVPLHHYQLCQRHFFLPEIHLFSLYRCKTCTSCSYFTVRQRFGPIARQILSILFQYQVLNMTKIMKISLYNIRF